MSAKVLNFNTTYYLMQLNFTSKPNLERFLDSFYIKVYKLAKQSIIYGRYSLE